MNKDKTLECPNYLHGMKLKQSEWKTLTDYEIEAIDDVTLGDYYNKKDAMDFARAIEQALRIKNDYQS